MIDRETVDRIYAAANIVDIIGEYVTLKRKGVNYQACCPFHNEKTPSFVVSPSKGVYKCFGCGKGGNAVTFLMEHENITYPEALKMVAKRYGIEVKEKEMSEEEVRRNDDRESMFALNGWAADYFANYLHHETEGMSVGMAYFRQKRGMTDATIKKFGLGFCPARGDRMSKDALAAGYKKEFLVSTGLSLERESDGSLYDRFRDRVIFPVHNISGRIVAFGGRTLRTDKTVAKYQNSPESEIYSKKRELYGLYFAKKAIQQLDFAIMVEGYTDVISMHQAGMNVRVVLLPEPEDPDSFARAHTAAEVQEYIRANEQDFLAFKAKLLLEAAQGDPIRKAALIADMVQSIAQIPDPIQRSVYIKECARIMDIDENILISEVARKRMATTGDREADEFVRRQTALRKAEAPQPEVEFVKQVEAGSSTEALERELVKYLLKYGHCSFEFKEGRTMVACNVAEVIFLELDSDGLTFRNPLYNSILATYREQWKILGTGVEVPAHFFLNHPDPEVCNASVDILTSDDNYVASQLWRRKDIHVESDAEMLAVGVPKAVTLYKSKVIESYIKEWQAKLADESLTDEQVGEVIQRLAGFNKVKVTIAKKLQRLIL